MIIKEITPKEAKEIIFEPEIFNRIDVGVKDFKLPFKNTTYIGGYVEKILIGVMVYFYREKFTTMHIHVLKKFRGSHAIRFGRKCLAKQKESVLYTNIPDKFKEVIRFAKYFKFKAVATQGGSTLYRRG